MGAAEAIGGSSFPLGMALTGILLDVMSRVLVAVGAIHSSRDLGDHGPLAG